MKTLVLSMISIAATVAAMTACTSESDPIDEIVNPKDAKVEIKLNAGVVDVTTKAGPVSTSDEKLFAENTPIQLIRWDHTGTLTDLTWTNGKYSEVTAKASGSTISFDTPQYYTTDGNNTSFIGFYPAIGDNVTLSNGIVQFTGLDGQTDILSAKLINAGSQITPASNPNIQFDHMLSQIKIKLNGKASADELFGKIKKITVANVPNSINITLGNESNAIAIPKESQKPAIPVMSSNDENGVSISTLTKEYIVLTPPSLGTASNTITINIETSKYGSEEPLTIPVNDLGENGTTSGTANEITLTFKDKITVTTGITEWDKENGVNKDYGIEEK